MSTLKVDTLKSADGTYEFGKCLAWVNFNGTGTVAISAALNMASITDNGTGDYTLNFTAAMPDASYAVLAGCTTSAGTNGTGINLHAAGGSNPPTLKSATACRIRTHSSITFDAYDASVAILR